MPVGINSPARNLFLLGSSGQAAVTNFFETIDQSAGTDGVYLPAEIKYIFSNQKYALAGSAQDSNAVGFGWFERQDYDLETGVLTTDYTNEVVNTQSLPTTLFAMELDANENLIVGGITGDVPWIAKYSNDGVLDWQSTTNSADVEYSGIASNSSGNYYACGSTQSANPQQAFVEKFDANGNPGWGKSAFMLGRHVMLDAIDANSRGQVVAVGHLEDDSYIKGYIVKIDTNTGEVLWDRTLDAGGDITLGDVFIDNNDQIYIVGTSLGPAVEGYIFKYTAEGNLIWQRKTNGSSLDNFTFDRVKSDGETEQTIVFGTYFDMNGNDLGGVLSKYAKDGSLVWRRTIFSSNNNSDSFSDVCLDADPSFYYLLYVDTEIDGLAGTPDSYTFGQVSSSGNGLGGFQYAEGTGETIDYQILNIGDTISRVSDGAVRNDSSDLITYPFTGNKIVFDDLSTQVTNKKRQMDDAGSFEYSGSPAIRPPDFQEVNLLGSVYSGSGDWLDQSGEGNDANTSTGEPFYGAGGARFDGSNDYLEIPNSTDFQFGTGNWTVEFWWRGEESGSFTSIISTLVTSNEAGTWRVGTRWNNNNYVYFARGTGSGFTDVRFDVNVNDGYWHHIAFVRNNGVIIPFVDGVNRTADLIGGSVSDSNSMTTNNNVRIGWNERDNAYIAGSISQLRVVKGEAIYTSNFTPTKDTLGSTPNTSLLTCQGNSIVDASSSTHSITVNGAVSDLDSERPTHNSGGWWEFQTQPGASAPYKGTPIDLPRDYSPDLIASGFTASWWQRGITTAGQAAQFVVVQGLMTNGNSDPQQSWRVERNNSTANTIEFGIQDGTTFSTNELISSNFPDGEWIHVTIKWDGSEQYIYKNGTLDSQRTFVGTPTHHPGGTIRIGSRQVDAPYAYNGDIGEFRLWDRSLTAQQIFQDYNATKSKYINEAPDTAPKNGPGISYNGLVLNYDFGNRATYDRAENVVGYSEDFTTTGAGRWVDAGNVPNANVTPNYGLSPFGEMKATRMINTDATPKFRRWQPNIANNGNYDTSGQWNCSVYAKALSNPCTLRINSYDGVSDKGTFFDLVNGAALSSYGGPDATSVEAVGNGWYRISQTTTNAANGGDHQLHLDPGADLLMFGAQMEQGNTPGRYIKTSGTAITAPTTVKNLTPIGNTFFYNATMGVLGNAPTFNPDGYFEFDHTNSEIIVLDGTATDPFPKPTTPSIEAWAYKSNWDDGIENRIFSCTQGGGYQIGVGESLMGSANVGSIMYVNGSYAITQYARSSLSSGWHYFAATWDAQTLRFYVDGTEVDTDGSRSGNVDYPTTTDFLIGGEPGAAGSPDSGKYLNGRVGEIRVYDRTITATEISQNFNATRGKYGV